MALRRCIKSESRSTTIVHYTNPEDGDFDEYHNSFRWTRAVALIDPEKDLKYGIERSSEQEIVSIIQDYGIYTEQSSFPNRESYPRYILTRAEIFRLLKNKDTTVSNSASWLFSFIESNLNYFQRNVQVSQAVPTENHLLIVLLVVSEYILRFE